MKLKPECVVEKKNRHVYECFWNRMSMIFFCFLRTEYPYKSVGKVCFLVFEIPLQT